MHKGQYLFSHLSESTYGALSGPPIVIGSTSTKTGIQHALICFSMFSNSTLNPRTFTFGGTSAIVTSMALIIGLESATAPTATIVSGLLIVAVADNISDSLSIHMYQEAERLDQRAALRATLTNFLARLIVALSFVMIVSVLPKFYAGIVALAWGFLLLVGLSCVLANTRGVSPLGEIGKHIGIAILVIVASRFIGTWILHHVSTSNSFG